uniref:Uncharacterized protein n=1 Tax=Amphimedon queenslandica TaxID=400682 RepID=A0A1X7SNZ3_AMPQE
METLLAMILALESTNTTTTDSDDTNDGDTNRMCTKINGGKVADKQQQPDISLNGAEKVPSRISSPFL